MILFVTKYDDEANRFGGMVRVKSIEKLVKRGSAQFLEIKLNPFSYNMMINDAGNKVIRAGFFRFDVIFSTLSQSKIIYFHAIGNFMKLYVYLFLLNKNVPYYIDLHGALPEQYAYSGSNIKSYLSNIFEKIAVKKSTGLVHVSKAMIKHFEKKYQYQTTDYFYPIFPSFSVDQLYSDLKDIKIQAKKDIGFSKNDTIVIYSGGVQSWQNVDEMVEFVATFAKLENVHFVFLSNQKEIFIEKFQNIPEVSIITVAPENLSKYYKAADYGLVFRDDHILNAVACPTKLSEYLYYGITPIVKSSSIGDFFSGSAMWKSRDCFATNSDFKSLTGIENHSWLVQYLSDSNVDQLNFIEEEFGN